MRKRCLSIFLVLVIALTSICCGKDMRVFAKKLVMKEYVSGQALCFLKSDVLYYKIKQDKTVEMVYFRSKKIKELVIPSKIKGKKVTSIGEFAFVQFVPESSRLKSVVITDSVKKIGTEAFCGCGNLIKLRLSNGLKEIKKEPL